MSDHAETKVCLMCAETIKAAARRCPHCQKAQTFWTNLTSDTAFVLISFVILISGFILGVLLLNKGQNFSAHQDEITVLTSQVGEVVTSSTNKELVVFGILTNRGNYTWKVGEFEVRFLDKNGMLRDVASASEYFTLLPHSEHAYRFSFYRRQLDPQSAAVKVYVRSAKDPKKS